MTTQKTLLTAEEFYIHRADGSVLSYRGDDMITDEELLPGFSLPLSEIFE